MNRHRLTIGIALALVAAVVVWFALSFEQVADREPDLLDPARVLRAELELAHVGLVGRGHEGCDRHVGGPGPYRGRGITPAGVTCPEGAIRVKVSPARTPN